MKFAYSCNGSPHGCEGDRFGGCQYHFDKAEPARRETVMDSARQAQRNFKNECDAEHGRYAITEGWAMFHAINKLIALYEEVTETN